jgi:hypothetical protein
MELYDQFQSGGDSGAVFLSCYFATQNVALRLQNDEELRFFSLIAAC